MLVIPYIVIHTGAISVHVSKPNTNMSWYGGGCTRYVNQDEGTYASHMMLLTHSHQHHLVVGL
jgi:hypothetical protein